MRMHTASTLHDVCFKKRIIRKKRFSSTCFKVQRWLRKRLQLVQNSMPQIIEPFASMQVGNSGVDEQSSLVEHISIVIIWVKDVNTFHVNVEKVIQLVKLICLSEWNHSDNLLTSVASAYWHSTVIGIVTICLHPTCVVGWFVCQTPLIWWTRSCKNKVDY